MVDMDFFSVFWKPFSLINLFFQQVKTVTEISRNPVFFGKTLFPLVQRDFVSSGNCFILFRVYFLQVGIVTETSLNKHLYFL